MAIKVSWVIRCFPNKYLSSIRWIFLPASIWSLPSVFRHLATNPFWKDWVVHRKWSLFKVIATSYLFDLTGKDQIKQRNKIFTDFKSENGLIDRMAHSMIKLLSLVLVYAEFSAFWLYNFATWPRYSDKGRGCCLVVEHTPRNMEVVGSNPAGCWAFSSSFDLFSLTLPDFLSFTSGVSLIRSLYNCVLWKKKKKNGCLSELPGAKQAQSAQIG